MSSIMNDKLQIMNIFLACPTVELFAISFARTSQKNAATIPHTNKPMAL